MVGMCYQETKISEDGWVGNGTTSEKKIMVCKFKKNRLVLETRNGIKQRQGVIKGYYALFFRKYNGWYIRRIHERQPAYFETTTTWTAEE